MSSVHAQKPKHAPRPRHEARVARDGAEEKA